MNVTEIVAAVATLGNEFQAQRDHLHSMEALISAVCSEDLRKHIAKVGIQGFMEGQSGTYTRAELIKKPKEPKKPDGNSLP
jgi:hypothetical protein